MIKIETNKIELALYTIDLKIAETIKNNTSKKYQELKEKITALKHEKMEIYKNNEEVVNKVLSEYLNEVKK